MGSPSVAKSQVGQECLSLTIAMGGVTQSHNMAQDPAEGHELSPAGITFLVPPTPMGEQPGKSECCKLHLSTTKTNQYLTEYTRRTMLKGTDGQRCISICSFLIFEHQTVAYSNKNYNIMHQFGYLRVIWTHTHTQFQPLFYRWQPFLHQQCGQGSKLHTVFRGRHGKSSNILVTGQLRMKDS